MNKTVFDFSDRIYWMVLAIAAACVITLGAFTWYFMNLNTQYDQITVQGDSVIKMTPDVSYLSLAVDTKADESADAVDQNMEATNAVLEAIYALGIEEAAIQTHSYSLNPSYEWVNDEYVETGYEAYQGITITVKDFTLLGDLISKTSAAGANRFNGVTFDLEDYEEEMAAAREEAITEARENAEAIAKASGANLGKLVSYYEYTDEYDYYGGKGGGGVMYAESMDMAQAETTVAQMQPGQEEITLTVSLNYRIK